MNSSHIKICREFYLLRGLRGCVGGRIKLGKMRIRVGAIREEPAGRHKENPLCAVEATDTGNKACSFEEGLSDEPLG